MYVWVCVYIRIYVLCNCYIPHTLTISTRINSAVAAAAIVDSVACSYYRLAGLTIATKSTSTSRRSSNYNVCNGNKVNSTLTTLLTTLRFVVVRWQFICQRMRRSQQAIKWDSLRTQYTFSVIYAWVYTTVRVKFVFIYLVANPLRGVMYLLVVGLLKINMICSLTFSKKGN